MLEVVVWLTRIPCHTLAAEHKQGNIVVPGVITDSFWLIAGPVFCVGAEPVIRLDLLSHIAPVDNHVERLAIVGPVRCWVILQLELIDVGTYPVFAELGRNVVDVARYHVFVLGVALDCIQEFDTVVTIFATALPNVKLYAEEILNLGVCWQLDICTI